HRQRIEQVLADHLLRIAYGGEVVGLVPARKQGEVGQQRFGQRRREAELAQAGLEGGAQGGGQVHRESMTARRRLSARRGRRRNPVRGGIRAATSRVRRRGRRRIRP